MNDFTDFSDRLLLLVIKQVESYKPGKLETTVIVFSIFIIHQTEKIAILGLQGQIVFRQGHFFACLYIIKIQKDPIL